MGRWAGVRPYCSSNNGKSRTGKQLEGQARSLTQRLVPVLWACQEGRAEFMRWIRDPVELASPSTVAGVVGRIRDRIAEHHGLDERLIFKPRHRGQWEDTEA